MKVSSKSGSLTWFNPTVCKVSKWSLSFKEYWEVEQELEQPWGVEVTTGPTSTELPTPKVPKVMAAINKDLLLEVFPRGLEVLSIPGGGPEVTADTLAPDPEVLELGSSETVTEVLFWLSWSESGDEEVGSFQDESQVWSKDQTSSQEVQSQSSYHQSSKLTCPTYQLSCHEVSSFSPVFVSPKFDVSFSVQFSVQLSLLLHSHDSKHTHEKCDQASNRWSKLHLCLFLCVKSFLFLFLCFLWSPFLFLFLFFYLLFLSWSSNGQILFLCLCSFLWSILYLLVLLCPWAQVLNPKKSRCACSWSTAPGCSSSARTCWLLLRSTEGVVEVLLKSCSSRWLQVRCLELECQSAVHTWLSQFPTHWSLVQKSECWTSIQVS